jgi:hypothetical protein
MASRTSIYEPQLEVPRVEMPGLASGNVGASVAKHAGGVLRVYERKLREEGAAWASSAITGLRKEYAQRLAEAEDSGEAGAGFADDIAKDFTTRVDDLRKEIPPYAEGAFNAGVVDIFNALGERGRAIEDEARSRQSEAEAGQAVDNLKSLAEKDLDSVESGLSEGRAIVAAVNPSDPARARLEAKLRDIPAAGIAAYGRRDPAGLLRALDSGEAGKHLPDAKTQRAVHARAKVDARRHAVRETAKTAASSTRAMLEAQAQIGRMLKGEPAVDYRDPDPQVLGRERARRLKKEMDDAQTQIERDADELDAAAKAMASGKRLDARDPAHRRGGNALYKDHFAPELQDLPDEEQRRRKIDFIALGGFVPDQVRDEVNADLRSGDPRRMAAAADFVHELETKDAAVGQAFDIPDRELARGVKALTRAGFDGAAAVKRILEGRELKGEDLARRGAEVSRLFRRNATADETGDAIRRALKLREGQEVLLEPPGVSASRGARVGGKGEGSARTQADVTPSDLANDEEAKNLQHYGYDPALLHKKMPNWQPILLFDDRIPEGYSERDLQRGFIRLNRRGFGGYLAHRSGTRQFAIMVKGVEASELRMNDVYANDHAGADQVDEVGDDIFQQCKAAGVFESIKMGGDLTVIGHSQGAPSAQLLGVYLIARALAERPPLLTEAQALAAIKVRAFGGIGARDYIERLHAPDGSKLSLPPRLLDRIDAITYVVSGDPLAQRASVPYVGRAYLLETPDPKTYDVTEEWAKRIDDLRPHARSAYKAADLKTARPFEQKSWLREATDQVARNLGDFAGHVVDNVTDWLY